MKRLDYECPYCDMELRGSFGDNVYCENCDKTFETDWDYSGDSIVCWLTGAEYVGRIDIDL